MRTVKTLYYSSKQFCCAFNLLCGIESSPRRRSTVEQIFFHEMNVWNIYFRINYMNIYCGLQCWMKKKRWKKKSNAFTGDQIECILVHNNTNKNPIKTSLYSAPTTDKAVWFAWRTGTQFTGLGFRQLQSGSLFNCNFLAFTIQCSFAALIPKAWAHECARVQT